ncbi:hypothetical protein D7T35_23990, partial [Salmonella enterica]|nr:hypothetical protein [Salmonella enterica]
VMFAGRMMQVAQGYRYIYLPESWSLSQLPGHYPVLTARQSGGFQFPIRQGFIKVVIVYIRNVVTSMNYCGGEM